MPQSKIKLIAVLTSFVCLLCLLSAQESGDLKEGQKIPDFQVGTYQSAADDNKPRVIVFFNSEQPMSEKVFKHFPELQAKFSKRGVVFIGIANEAPAVLQNVANNWHLRFPLLADLKRSAFDKFKIFVLPATFMVDKNGVLVRYLPIYPNNYDLEVASHLEWLCGDITKEELAKKLQGDNKQLNEKERKELYNLNMARRLWLRGQKSLAESLLLKVQKQFPDFLPAFLQAGSWELLNKRYDKALTIFQTYATKFPKEPDPALGVAVALRLLGKTKEAKAALQQYEQFGGRKYRLYYEQARLSADEVAQKDYLRKAGELLHNKLEDGEAHDLYEKGLAAEKANRLAEALKLYRQALETAMVRDLVPVPDPVVDTSKQLEEHSMTKPDSVKKPK